MMQLYPHQQKALKETEKLNRVAYYLDMGLGKTFIGSEKLYDLNETINLVICQKSKIRDWFWHFKNNYPYLTVFDLTIKNHFIGFWQWVEKEKDREPGNYISKITCVGIINYDLVFRRLEFLNLNQFTLMLDESSIIQNETAKRTKFILKMKPANVILLSGTPTAGKYEKLWSQIHLLGWKISKNLFYRQYVITEWIEDKESGFRIPVVVGYKNVERLKRKLAEYGAVFMKSEEVFDLPEQTFITVKNKPTKYYQKFMKDDLVTVNEREFIGDTNLSKRIYSRMLCSYLNPERIAAFTDLIHSTEDRLIVFYNFDDELFSMCSIVEKMERPISIVNGKIKDLEAYEKKNDSVTFVQYQAGAMGLNLQKANKVIYFSLTDRTELFEQSKKRIHRIGQNNKCFYYIMLCPGTIEADILKTLKERKDYTDELFKKFKAAYAG